ncbi:MAG: flavodoxin family protein [Deltaproteobacteria bacterium]|jgi:multimeric flavodoxin WrbA|nr:flavodoxin family protein [Deltaproteobacteria bacterium]
MKVYAINGSPRTNWNTGQLLVQALKGAASKGAETELIHLYNLDYNGCTSCFGCKLKGGKSYGKCAMRDGLTPLLNKLETANAFLIGSPIYFGTVTGEVRSFMERLLFPYMVYAQPPQSLFENNIRTAFIYTMNVSEDVAKQYQYPVHFDVNEKYLARMFGQAETLCAYETLQFEDYDKVVFDYFDPAERRTKYAETFPKYCRQAFEIGSRMTKPLVIETK